METRDQSATAVLPHLVACSTSRRSAPPVHHHVGQRDAGLATIAAAQQRAAAESFIDWQSRSHACVVEEIILLEDASGSRL